MKKMKVRKRVYWMLGVFAVYWIWSHPRLNSDFGFLFPERKGRVYITNKWSGWFERGYKMSVISNQPLDLHLPDYRDGMCEENCQTTDDGGIINEFLDIEMQWNLVQPSGDSRRPFKVELDEGKGYSVREWNTHFFARHLYEGCPLLKSKPLLIKHIQILKYGDSGYEIFFNPEKTEFCIDVARF